MRVLSVAFPFAPVRPDTPGGAEQVLLTLDKALCSLGHTSFVVARSDSDISGTLVPVQQTEGMIDENMRASVHEEYRSVIGTAIGRFQIDIVHMHGLDFHDYVLPDGPPVLVTLHLPLEWYPADALCPGRPGVFFNCVSRSQMITAPDESGPFLCVENGVELAGYPEKTGRHYVLCMGRICPEKGFHLAMDAAKSAGLPFILAGAVFEYGTHKDYFNRVVVPRLDSRCVFIGAVGPDMKKKLLAEAMCLMAPSLVPETSSLVAMEALASGTPVVAFPNGALAEIVEHGKTGFLVRGHEEMTEAIKACEEISPEACRMAAAERFSSAMMVKKYFSAYEKIISGGVRLNVNPHRDRGDRQPRRA